MPRTPESHNNEQRPGTQKPRDLKEGTAGQVGQVAGMGGNTKK